MAERLRAHLPLIAVLVVAGLAGTATLTYAAGRQLGSAPGSAGPAAAPAAPLVVPDLHGQAFVFAKGALEDAGFAWKVAGSVHGYSANTVVAQSPAAGTKVVDTGAPPVTLTLKRNGSYPQAGEAQDVSPYAATALQLEAAAGLGPAHPATTATTTTPAATTTAPAATTPATTTSAPAATTQATTTQATTTTAAEPAATAKAATKAGWPASRPPAFTVPGARPEPLDEMPLPNRAQALRAWLDTKPARTNANVKRWLYQNAWIVAGAKLGWWHGADALATLVAADSRAQDLWGLGAKSAKVARAALSEVQARSK